jgi:predicted nucleotidyltransferase
MYHLHARDREVILQNLSQALAGRGDIAFAYAYGSFLRPEGFHDIDVAVWTGRSQLRTRTSSWRPGYHGSLAIRLMSAWSIRRP